MAVKEVAELLDKIGLIDIIIPFMLVFTIFYAVLERTKVLGSKEKGRRINAIVSLVISLFTVMAVNSLNLMDLIIRYFVIILMIGFFIALILGMVGSKAGNNNKLLMGSLGIIMILVLFYGLMDTGLLSKIKMQSILFPLIILTALVATIIIVFSKFKGAPSTTPSGKRSKTPVQAPSATPGGAPAGTSEPTPTPQPRQRQITQEQLEKLKSIYGEEAVKEMLGLE